ncbi:acyltransferase family protein [Paenibacillus hexagrammi]|uniref:Acyltransferase n=1 Tax=Paenibacillus hexagrammi TaxID=2908839 RepID=A0ABY3SKB3_9BACL|nr:acyltransferase [Paenibacillus sp. YPD9-1]UJF33595.1 acyltransferase [Paenibacillus sp. YPD9-1]
MVTAKSNMAEVQAPLKGNALPGQFVQETGISGRRYDLDNLKVWLTILVVIHHAGQPYGGSNGFWYFKTSQQADLGRFFSVNAGFFMSLFFLISAYFLPGSLDRKGAAAFLKDRLVRFGIPLLAGFLIIMPLLLYVYYIHYRGYGFISFSDYYLNVYFGLAGKPSDWTGPSFPDLQFGHLWFIEQLLFYSVIYAIIRFAVGNRLGVCTTFLARACCTERSCCLHCLPRCLPIGSVSKLQLTNGQDC